MNEKFSIEVDRSHGLVRITMSGLFKLGDVHDFYAARRRAHEELGLPKNAHLTLNDVREVKILPQETLAAILRDACRPRTSFAPARLRRRSDPGACAGRAGARRAQGRALLQPIPTKPRRGC